MTQTFVAPETKKIRVSVWVDDKEVWMHESLDCIQTGEEIQSIQSSGRGGRVIEPVVERALRKTLNQQFGPYADRQNTGHTPEDISNWPEPARSRPGAFILQKGSNNPSLGQWLLWSRTEEYAWAWKNGAWINGTLPEWRLR